MNLAIFLLEHREQRPNFIQSFFIKFNFAPSVKMMANEESGREEPKTAIESTPLLVPAVAVEGGDNNTSRNNDDETQRTTEATTIQSTAREPIGLEPADAEAGRDGYSQSVPIPIENDPSEAIDMKLDDYYQMGRYVYMVCLLAQMLLLSEVGDLLFMTYAGAAPTVLSCGSLNFTTSDLKPDQRCDLLQELYDSPNKTLSDLYQCSNSKNSVALDYQFNSINVEFDQLFCKTSNVKLGISLQMLGIIPGSVLFGWLSDAYGRRLVMLGTLICWILSMFAASFAFDLVTFVLIRFIVCFFNAGIAVTLIVFTSELYPKKNRFCLMNLITWAPNYILFGIIAYLCREWRLLQRVLAILAMPCIGLILFLSESPRFLISARKMAEAKKAIIRMHKFDGRYCDEVLLDEILEREHKNMLELSQKKKKYNYLHLFYSWKFALYTVSVSFSLFVVTLITYALIYNMDKLSGSPYWNMIFMGVFKYSMNLLIAFADMRFKWLGRKMSHLISECLVIGSLGTYMILHLSDVNVSFVANTLIVAAVGFCGVLFNANKLAGSELFPTGVRNLSCSFGQVCSRIGVVCAPLIFFLKDACATNFCPVLPHLTLIILAALDVFFFQLFVKETKDRPLITEFPVKHKSEKVSSEKKNGKLDKSSNTKQLNV